jgi:hypothetical protein
MLLPVKLICRTKRVHEDGTCTIFIQYCYADKKILLHTGIKVPACYWNRKQQCIVDTLPTENGVAAELNKELLHMRSVVNALALKAKAIKTEERGKFMKASLYVRPKPKDHGLGNQIEGFFESGQIHSDRVLIDRRAFSPDLASENVEEKISEKETIEKKRQQATLDVYYQFDEYIMSI